MFYPLDDVDNNYFSGCNSNSSIVVGNDCFEGGEPGAADKIQ